MEKMNCLSKMAYIIFLIGFAAIHIVVIIKMLLDDAIKRYHITVYRECSDKDNELIRLNPFIIYSDHFKNKHIINEESDIFLYNAIKEDKVLVESNSCLNDGFLRDLNDKYSMVKIYYFKLFTSKKYIYRLIANLESAGYRVDIKKNTLYW